MSAPAPPSFPDTIPWQALLNWAKELGLTPRSAMVVVTLYTEGGSATYKTLREATGTSSAAFTGVVDYLSNKGLVHRVKSKSDRRVYSLKLTDKAREEVAALNVTAIEPTPQADTGHQDPCPE